MSRTGTRKSKTFADLLRRKIAGRSELGAAVRNDELNVSIARRVFDLRTAAGLSQSALAKKVGTTQSVISRIEDADYAGHSLSLLRRIADALDSDLLVTMGARPKVVAPRARKATTRAKVRT
jgi:ribosome-binding protein aMBF1 (putative translation factor)